MWQSGLAVYASIKIINCASVVNVAWVEAELGIQGIIRMIFSEFLPLKKFKSGLATTHSGS